MAGLDIKFSPLPSVQGAGLAHLAGAIDANTIIEFQQALDDIQSKGVNRLILDFSEVKYVNSTGLGSLVKYADTFKQAGGGVSLMKVPAKVKIVIEMLGLNAFFEMCANQEEALAALEKAAGGGGGGGGSTRDITPKAAPKGPTKMAKSAAPRSRPAPPPAPGRSAPSGNVGMATPPTMPTGGNAPSTPAPPAATPAPTSAPPPSTGSGSNFRIVCQSCNLEMDIPNPGNFQCPRCFTMVSVGRNGNANFQRANRVQPVTLSLNCSPACTEAFKLFVSTLARSSGFGDNVVNAMIQMVGEVSDIITQQVYEGNSNANFHVLIDSNNGRFTMRISDYGKTISPNLVSSLFRKTQQVMPEFQCTPHPRGGNIINMARAMG